MTYNVAVCTVKKTPDDGQRNCPKHVEFYSKNKFEKLVHQVGFIIRKYFSLMMTFQRSKHVSLNDTYLLVLVCSVYLHSNSVVMLGANCLVIHTVKLKVV